MNREYYPGLTGLTDCRGGNGSFRKDSTRAGGLEVRAENQASQQFQSISSCSQFRPPRQQRFSLGFYGPGAPGPDFRQIGASNALLGSKNHRMSLHPRPGNNGMVRPGPHHQARDRAATPSPSGNPPCRRIPSAPVHWCHAASVDGASPEGQPGQAWRRNHSSEPSWICQARIRRTVAWPSRLQA